MARPPPVFPESAYCVSITGGEFDSFMQKMKG